MRSHVERRCSNLGQTQSRISPKYALVCEDNGLSSEEMALYPTPSPVSRSRFRDSLVRDSDFIQGSGFGCGVQGRDHAS